VIRSVSVEARRWFQRTYGNTYHTVRVQAWDADHRRILDAVSPVTYGYGDHFLHTAGTLLADAGLLPTDDPYDFRPYWMQRDHGVFVAADVVDVPRKRDLHRPRVTA
jgi:hypothetical protein